MRWNKLELTTLALQPSFKFDKEGVLVIWERQDSFFFKKPDESVHDGKANKKRRSSLRDLTCIGGAVRKVCAERWCRLRGNLLFYFRSHEPWSEPAGIIVLTDVKVNIDLQSHHVFSFTLVFPGGGHQRVSALSPEERNEWISALSRSSYNSAKDELQRLEAQLADLKLKLKNLPRLPSPQSTLAYPACLPLCELWFSCDNLRCSAQGQPPSIRLRIAIAVKEDPLWLPLLRTEIVPKCSNPSYLTTLPVTPDLVVPSNSARLRITACDVKDIISHTSIILATAEVTLKSLLTQIQSGRVRLQLVNAQGDGMGFVTLATSVVWDHMIPPAAPANGSPARAVEETVEVMGHRRTQSLPPRLNIACPPLPPVGLSHIFLANPRLKTYRLQSGLGGDIVVHESMFESRLNNYIPQQLLRLWIRQEKENIADVAKLGNLYPPWHQRQLALLDRCLKRLNEYEDALKVVSERGSFYKASTDKTDKKLYFLPTNLHVQRIFAHNASLRRTGVFDWVTVGAWSAMTLEPSSAGLSKLLSQDSVQGSVTSELKAIRNTIASLKRSMPQLMESCRLLLAATMAKAVQPILKLAESLASKTMELLKIWDAGLCERASRFYEQHKRPTVSEQNQPSLLPIKAMAQAVVKELQTLNTHFPCDAADVENANDDDREPAEVVGLNMEASLTVLAGKLEALLGSLNDAGPVLKSLLKRDAEIKNGEAKPLKDVDWAEVLRPCLSKLESTAEMMLKNLALAEAVLRVQEESQAEALAHTVQFRRDVVFSQALTAVTTALCAQLHCNHSTEFLTLLNRGGQPLVLIEGLLSAIGLEAVMLGDMIQAATDIEQVTFKIVPVKGNNDNNYLPKVYGSREVLEVSLPVSGSVWSKVNHRSVPGRGLHALKFRLTCAFFNVGINEEATLAEQFGDYALQTDLNRASFSKLKGYYHQFKKFHLETATKKGPSRLPVSSLLLRLEKAVEGARSKDTSILQLASKIARQLLGLRVTSCKSAKDRTGMAVTLEETQILQNDFDLAEHDVTKVMSCFRSQGTRIENTAKNVGKPRYAFHRLQLMTFPMEYRPPPGTYGNVQS